MKTTEEKLVNLSPDDLAHARFYGKKTRISVAKDFFEAGYKQLSHIHDFPQIWLCIYGSCRHTVGGKTFDMKKGDMITVPIGAPHSLEILTDSEFFSLSISLELFLKNEAHSYERISLYALLGAFADDICERLGVRVTSLSEDSFEAAKASLSRLSVTSEPFSEQMCEANKIFALPELDLSLSETKKAREALEKKALPLIRVHEYINERFSEKISTAELLKVSYLCQTTFFSLFKDFFGMRSAYYIQRLRVSHAVFYLSHTSYDIATVSDFCGFNSPSHLVLCHKKQTGMLPKYLRYRLKEYYERNPESKKTVRF